MCRPSPRHLAQVVEIPADPVEAGVAAAGMIDVEDDEVGPAIARDVGHGDAAALVLRAEPAGDLVRLGEAVELGGPVRGVAERRRLSPGDCAVDDLVVGHQGEAIELAHFVQEVPAIRRGRLHDRVARMQQGEDARSRRHFLRGKLPTLPILELAIT